MTGDPGHKKKHRESQEFKSLMNRLARVEGQVRGIRRMVENEDYCVDILTQVWAVQAALNAFSRELLGNHIRTCVAEGVRADDQEVIDELVQVMGRLLR